MSKNLNICFLRSYVCWTF